MTAFVLEIPQLFGLSLSVYIILLLIGIPVYFLWRWLFRRWIKGLTAIKPLTWLITFITTPLIYVGIVLLGLGIISYYPARDFNAMDWKTDRNSRYELSENLIKSHLLIGKSKEEVRTLLGKEKNTSLMRTWTYYLGIKPGLGVDESILKVHFQNNKVTAVEEL